MGHTIKFVFNGIKLDGKLYKGSWHPQDDGSIEWLSDSYGLDAVSEPVFNSVFGVGNGDPYMDYSPHPSILFTASDPHYDDVYIAHWSNIVRRRKASASRYHPSKGYKEEPYLEDLAAAALYQGYIDTVRSGVPAADVIA